MRLIDADALNEKFEKLKEDGSLPDIIFLVGAQAVVDTMPEITEAVVLPDIPKGKTLYWLWTNEIMPVRYKGIHHGCVDRHGKFHIVCEMTTKQARTFIHGKNEFTIPAGDKRYFYADDIEKTIFFTRKAAVER